MEQVPIVLFIILTFAAPTIINRCGKIFLLLKRVTLWKNPSCTNFSHSYSDNCRLPRVAIHVPICNEDPHIVIETLRSIESINYPNYVVLIISNNTTSRRYWKPIERFCSDRCPTFIFYHIENLTGYKAGALNYALKHTPDDVEFISVIDADNIVSPNYLSELIPCFTKHDVAIIQSPLGFKKDPKKACFESWIF